MPRFAIDAGKGVDGFFCYGSIYKAVWGRYIIKLLV
jgi:hypothetical protein